VRTPPAVVLAEKDRRSGRPGTVELHTEAVQRAITVMHERLDEPLSLDTMAEAAILSRYHFSRVFHRVTGLPPGRFLAVLRLAEAKRLLLTTQLSVTDICFRVGYNSLGTFTMRFTQHVGISPGRFRQLRHMNSAFPSAGKEPRDGERASTSGMVTGRIEAPVGPAAPVFIGLFTDHVPVGRPRRCAILTAPGEYRIEDTPKGSYNVFAVSFPWPREPLDMLLPDHASLRVASSTSPVRVRVGETTECVDLELRQAVPTDPPILVALPLLLARQVEREAIDADVHLTSDELVQERQRRNGRARRSIAS
jgi:AraC family transcriptional regulator